MNPRSGCQLKIQFYDMMLPWVEIVYQRVVLGYLLVRYTQRTSAPRAVFPLKSSLALLNIRATILCLGLRGTSREDSQTIHDNKGLQDSWHNYLLK